MTAAWRHLDSRDGFAPRSGAQLYTATTLQNQKAVAALVLTRLVADRGTPAVLTIEMIMMPRVTDEHEIVSDLEVDRALQGRPPVSRCPSSARRTPPVAADDVDRYAAATEDVLFELEPRGGANAHARHAGSDVSVFDPYRDRMRVGHLPAGVRLALPVGGRRPPSGSPAAPARSRPPAYTSSSGPHPGDVRSHACRPVGTERGSGTA